MSALTAAMKCALAGAIKPKALRLAKDELADGSSESIDFTLRVRGTVKKGAGTPETTEPVPDTVDLFHPAIVAEMFKRCGIGRKRITRLLGEIAADPQLESLAAKPHAQDFSFVLREANAAATEARPPRTRIVDARAGAVTSSVDVELIT
ncbi:MAG: hypothetical protein AAGE65_09560 [Planctomycetota bacterium]